MSLSRSLVKSHSLEDRLRGLLLRGEKYATKGIQYNPHDLPKNALLCFSMFTRIRCPILSIQRIHHIIYDFPVPTEYVPLSSLADCLRGAFAIPDKLVFIITALVSSVNKNVIHANLIVVDKTRRRIDVFDPLGKFGDAEFRKERELQEFIIREFLCARDECYSENRSRVSEVDYPQINLNAMKVYSDSRICAASSESANMQEFTDAYYYELYGETENVGIQVADSRKKRDGEGFCRIWACLVAQLCHESPDKTLRQIVGALTGFGGNTTNICRGFLEEMRDGAVQMMGKKFARLYLELREAPVRSGKAKSAYHFSEKWTMEYLRGFVLKPFNAKRLQQCR